MSQTSKLRLASSIVILGFWVSAHGQNKEKEAEKKPNQVVECASLQMLSGLLKTLGPRARCRLEFEDLVCLPGSVVTTDVKQERDLCLNEKKKPVQAPRCAGKKRQTYKQRMIERAHYRVDYNDGRSQVELLDLPFTFASRRDVLARAKPVLRPGPDACVYFRRELIIMGKSGEQR